MSGLSEIMSVSMDKITNSVSQLNEALKSATDVMSGYERGAEQGFKFDVAPDEKSRREILDKIDRVQNEIDALPENFQTLCGEYKTFLTQGFNKAETIPAAAEAIKKIENLDKQPEPARSHGDIIH